MSAIEVSFDQLDMMRSWPEKLPPVAHSAAVAIMMFTHYKNTGASPQECGMAERDLYQALEQLAWIEHCAAEKGIRSETFDYDEYENQFKDEG